MNKVRVFIQNIAFSETSAPVAFFVLCVLSFGLLIPDLGFYMDDWPYIFYAKVRGIEGLQEMLYHDSRPNAAWLYMTAFRLLDFNPVSWHVFALLMRFATVIAFWTFLRSMWSERKREAVYATLLFAIYPFFMLQPFAVGSTHHWFGFLAFNTSLVLMVHSMQAESRKKWLFAVPALALEAAHLFTSEYFSGLELIRPVILWILISRIELPTPKKAARFLLDSLPYLIVLGMFFYWRVFVFESPPPMVRNDPVILKQLFSEPFKAIGFLLSAFLADTISILTFGWQRATDPGIFAISSPFVLFKLLVCVFALGLSYFYLKRLTLEETESNTDDWKGSATAMTIAALMTAGLPVWFIGRSIVESKNLLSASRFGIPAMFGASLLTLLLAEYFISNKTKRVLFLALLLGLAVNFHLDNTKDFRYSWEKQKRFIHQLVWRAPMIETGTSILTDEEIIGIMGEYPLSFSINLAYRVEDIGYTPPYWYFPFYYTNPNIDALLQGESLEYVRLNMHFKGNSSQMLLLDYNPEMNRCLWVIQPQDTNLRLISTDMRRLAAGSDISLIKPTGTSAPPEDIYGKPNTDTWCYYFQKADLARQFQQWDEVLRLWDEAQAAGKHADNGFEYIPFIEGFGHTADWEQVKTLTRFAKRITAGLEPSLCTALDRLAANVSASRERDETIIILKDDLACSNYQ